MSRRGFQLIVTGLLSVVAACERDDIGDPCPQLAAANAQSSTDGTRTETEEVVEQNPLFPCDELVCIATDGKPGYCSKKCRSDVSCPDGFECRVVQEIGPMAGEKFCAWKRCDARRDCGNVDDFCCSPVPGALPGDELKLCSFSDGGKCS